LTAWLNKALDSKNTLEPLTYLDSSIRLESRAELLASYGTNYDTYEKRPECLLGNDCVIRKKNGKETGLQVEV